jgi:hypothetical protein
LSLLLRESASGTIREELEGASCIMPPEPPDPDHERSGHWRAGSAILTGIVLVVLGNLISYGVWGVLSSPARRTDSWYAEYAVSAMIRGGLLQLIGWPVLIAGIYQIVQRLRRRH